MPCRAPAQPKEAELLWKKTGRTWRPVIGLIRECIRNPIRVYAVSSSNKVTGDARNCAILLAYFYNHNYVVMHSLPMNQSFLFLPSQIPFPLFHAR